MPHASQQNARIRALARSRGGVVSLAELHECGFTTSAVRRRVAEGTWQRFGRAFVLVPVHDHRPSALSDTALSWILHLTFGPQSLVSGVLALRRAGWSLPCHTHAVVVPDKTHGRLAGVHVLRRPTPSMTPTNEPQFVHPGDALLDCLIIPSFAVAADLLDSALQKRYVTADSLGELMSPRLGRGRRGAEQLRRLLARARSGSRSEAEQQMARLLARSGTGPWVANRPVLDEQGRVTAEIDFAHEDLRIAIEVDGRAFHSDRRSFERDRARQNTLTLEGWLVLRFTWEQITRQPEVVIAAVRDAVAQRSAA